MNQNRYIHNLESTLTCPKCQRKFTFKNFICTKKYYNHHLKKNHYDFYKELIETFGKCITTQAYIEPPRLTNARGGISSKIVQFQR